MGLLSRAGSHFEKKTVLSGRSLAVGQSFLPGEPLDEMGKALRERLGRLSQKKTTPYTALSLLKAYGAFHIGICLSLNDGNYSSYVSVGFGIEKISIPQEIIWSETKAHNKYFKLDSQLSIGTSISKKKLIYWVFPLDPSIHSTREPWETIMILGALDPSDFNPEPVSVILDDVADKLLSPIDSRAFPPADPQDGILNLAEQINQDTELDFAEPPSGETTHHHSLLEEKITQFHQMHLDFNCIVLENPAGNPNFCDKVSSMLDTIGTIIPLTHDRPLILFPIVMDRELIAHRLSRTLKTKILLSFAASNPENALIRIDALM